MAPSVEQDGSNIVAVFQRGKRTENINLLTHGSDERALVGGSSTRNTLINELWTSRWPSQAMKPQELADNSDKSGAKLRCVPPSDRTLATRRALGGYQLKLTRDYN